jgi:hypothetical protein
MKIAGNKQRLCCGAWLLAALLIGGLNVSPLISMEAQPQAGYSRTVRELQTDLQRLDAILAAQLLPLRKSWELSDFSRPSQSAGSVAADPTPPRIGTASRDRVPEAAPLPTLSGIIQTMAPNGSVYFQAVLNGRSCREKDKLNDFTIEKITPSGVVVRHARATWFIPCPTPFFSSDQGE